MMMMMSDSFVQPGFATSRKEDLTRGIMPDVLRLLWPSNAFSELLTLIAFTQCIITTDFLVRLTGYMGRLRLDFS